MIRNRYTISLWTLCLLIAHIPWTSSLLTRSISLHHFSRNCNTSPTGNCLSWTKPLGYKSSNNYVKSRPRGSQSVSIAMSSVNAIEDDIPPLTATPPMKILLVVEPTPFNYISGYANRFKEMLDHLHLAGDQVHVITTDGSKNPPTKYKDYTITNLRGLPLPKYPTVRVSPDITLRIRHFLKRLRPDLIHISTPSLILYPAIFWAKLMKVPIVMSFHTNTAEYVRAYYKGILRSALLAILKVLTKLVHNAADLTLCTSPQVLEELRDHGVRNLDIWRKGINTNIFSPKYKNEAMRHKLSEGNPDAPLFLFVGRIGSEKRLDRLRNVLDAIPGARLALVGNGPTEKYLKEHFKGYPVNFVGSLTGEALSQAFASSDIFLMPSDSETLGFVVLEAMASGLPVVAVNAGGLPDIVENGKNGFLAENESELKEFIQYTKRLVEDKELRSSLGLRARKWAESWSWETATSILRNVHYPRAINAHRLKNIRHA